VFFFFKFEHCIKNHFGYAEVEIQKCHFGSDVSPIWLLLYNY